MTIPVHELVFYGFSALLILSATMVVASRNPVRGALFLVFCFFCSSALWMLMEAEFLALALIFVYVGAVMTLFLFVVMMLNMASGKSQEGYVKYLPFGLIIMCIVVGLMLYVLGPGQGIIERADFSYHALGYSNVKELGEVLYTQYFYPFELAAVLLVVAIIAAITLAFRGKQHRRAQNIAKQLSVSKKDRLRLVDPKPEQS